jgi:transcriptional regulator
MYVPPHFRQDDPAELRAVMRTARLGTVITVADGAPLVSHVPVMFIDDGSANGTLLCHVSRANAQWRHVTAQTEALVIFMGPDAYVSPNFYASKNEHGKVVPTWNYIAVHAYGPVRVIEDPGELRALVDRLTALHEAGEPVPWRPSDAPPSYIDAQVQGIVGLEIPIARIDGKWKLSQNRSEADVAGAVAALEASPRESDRATAAAMDMLRQAQHDSKPR